MTRISILNLEATKRKTASTGSRRQGSDAVSSVIYDLGGVITIDQYTAWNFGSTLPFAVQSLQAITSLDAEFTEGVVDHGIFNLDIVSNHNPAQLLAVCEVPAQYIKLTNLIGAGEYPVVDAVQQTIFATETASVPDSRLRDYAVKLYASLSGNSPSLSVSI